MGCLQELPAHRYRMNALLGRTRGRLGDYRRACDRLWEEARRIDVDVVLQLGGGRRVARVASVETGPARGPFLVDLAFAPDFSPVGLRFQAQRLTLEAAVDSLPGWWGAAAAVGVAPEEISDAELKEALVATIDQVVSAGSIVHPWCAAADLFRTRLREHLPALEGRIRCLRAWRMARASHLMSRDALTASVLRAVLRTWWAERQEQSTRCRVAVVGHDAAVVAGGLLGSAFIEVRRAADEGAIYSPTSVFPGATAERGFVVTGPWDGGVLTEPVDALVLLPGAPPIDRAAADTLLASAVVEVGENIVLPEADGILAGRRIDILPDLLFAATTAIACRAFVDGRRRSTTSVVTRISFDVGRLVREVMRDAAVRGRSLREQLYLRALGNLQA